MLDKVWSAHEVEVGVGGPDGPSMLYVDLQLLHEVTSPQAFAELGRRGLSVRCPERALATMDHATPTTRPRSDGSWPELQPAARRQLDALTANCRQHGIRLYAVGDPERGIVHVIGPELGAVHPGMTVVCGDSHTSTHGAFGALAFGIGTTEVGHALATQCLLLRRPQAMAVELHGRPGPGCTAKDLALAVLRRTGMHGGTGAVFEYRGEAVLELGMAGRMTLCNMSIEGGARAGMVAPDETTFAWLEGRQRAPRGAAFDAAVERWRTLRSDPGAAFDRSVSVDVDGLGPQITYGTHPGMVIGVGEAVPPPRDETEAQALRYMQLQADEPLLGRAIDVVFVGSCTNGRLEDLRDAARVMAGRTVARGVRALVVPGSGAVQAAAEREGLGAVFRAAGAEWAEPGCSLCLAMNGDAVPPGRYALSTSNRNFRGRQGEGSRTFLASPLTAAAAAVTGCVTDPRDLIS
jgi:3-isopropylmalate/(R)-2-methylmalate dehydratase large subunit